MVLTSILYQSLAAELGDCRHAEHCRRNHIERIAIPGFLSPMYCKGVVTRRSQA
ncbi:hypothetical protein BDV06DRAFT_193706 [Aspergillus oleicola]